MTRKLVAIMALDVVGYSRRMSEDEAGTLAQLSAVLAKVVEPAVAKHQGRIVKTMGDGVLAEFASAVEAVDAAVGIQRAMAEHTTAAATLQPLTLRIGINLGDVITQDDDLFGHGVNVAARLETMAEPGGICVSSGIEEQVRHRLEVELDDLGPHELKNIPFPVRVFRVRTAAGAKPETAAPETTTVTQRRRWPLALAGLVLALAVAAWLGWPTTEPAVPTPAALPPATPAAAPAAPAVAGNPSILVLPFDDLSEERNQGYFVDGITEDIITDLSHFSGLKVLARNTSFRFKDQAVDPQQVGRELEVTHLLEGSVRRAGDKLRINAQLIETANGSHVWAQRYDKQLVDLFAVQDEVTQHIVTALALQLTEQEQRVLEEATRGNIEAYDLLLQGLRVYNFQTAESNREAMTFYRRAIDTDPTYGRGYGALAIALSREAQRGWADDPTDAWDRALELANRAVSLSPDLPQVHWAKGYVHMQRGEQAEAARAVERAITVAPNYADGYGLLGLVENRLGHGDKALRLIRKGMALNPYYSWDYLYNLGFAHYLLGEYAEAADALERTLARNENATPARIILAAVYSAQGRRDDAEWEVDQLTMLQDNISIAEIATYGASLSFEDPAQVERFLGHLREAGVPE
ncbi:MAG TPA: adenylate/guanylate cyclase domain-containing protein [Gammaproteobacteria bacterium]